MRPLTPVRNAIRKELGNLRETIPEPDVPHRNGWQPLSTHLGSSQRPLTSGLTELGRPTWPEAVCLLRSDGPRQADRFKWDGHNQGYTGEKPATAAQAHGIALEVVKLAEAKRGFVLLPCRWAVERAFAWAARFRRLARDYQRLPTTLAGLHLMAFATLMLAKAVAAFDLVRDTL